MYNYQWDKDTRGYILTPSITGVVKEVRPVFYEELKLLGFDEYWNFPKTDNPLLWSEGSRRYIHDGELVAEAHGGGFYTKPTLDIKKSPLTLTPVDVEGMIEKNALLMKGLVQDALEFIYTTHQIYSKKRYDVCYVAFSGGKDSLVVLDLVQRALAKDDFYVVFGDTGMEIKSTYESVERAKTRWRDLRFYTARSRYSPEETWEEFGPPSRIHRWCCSVHKSAPSLLLLRELNGEGLVRALVFDGIRAEESDQRSKYSRVMVGGKHNIQVNASPLLTWSSAEVFLYLFERDLLLNDAYRYGLVRVGCAVCPVSSRWWDYVANEVYKDDLKVYLDKIARYTEDTGIPDSQREKYIEEGGWKGRAGGRGLANSAARVIEQADSSSLTFFIREVRSEWLEWAKAMGDIMPIGGGHFYQKILDKTYRFSIAKRDLGIEVHFDDIHVNVDRKAVGLIRNVASKTAYCIGCQVCMVECPSAALHIDDSGVHIDESRCMQCFKCLEMYKGCLVAKSLNITTGGNKMVSRGSSLNKYQHFGLRQNWLSAYFDMKDDLWTSEKLGNRQIEALKVWLRDAEITDKNKITPLGENLAEFGADSLLTWSVIWNNLVYNSTIVRWYALSVPWKNEYTKDELIDMLGDDYSVSTRSNALTSLFELLRHSPLGDELSLGKLEMSGKNKRIKSVYKMGWEHPNPISILHALYRYAENEDGRYDFTLSQLEQSNTSTKGVSPIALFGVDSSEVRKILQGLATEHPDHIDVEFTRGLDNIFLRKERHSLDVLRLNRT
jgi:phosphoadenosine phosphosulfate reductase